MIEKLITKSFERLLDKGKHRGFITYEELGKSLGKRNSTYENIEKAFIVLVDEKITLVEKKSQYQSNKKKEASLNDLGTAFNASSLSEVIIGIIIIPITIPADNALNNGISVKKVLINGVNTDNAK